MPAPRHKERRALLREIAAMQNLLDEIKAERDTERAKSEELNRQITELTAKLREAELLNRLYEEGRLKSKG